MEMYQTILKQIKKEYEESNYDSILQTIKPLINKDKTEELNTLFSEILNFNWDSKNKTDVVYLITGAAYYALGMIEKALEHFKKAVEIKPSSVAYALIGNAFYKLNQFDEAIINYNKAIDLDSKNSNSYNGKGHVFNDLLKFTDAVEVFSKALELDPSLLSAYIGRGNAFFYLANYEKAILDYNKAIELYPEFWGGYFNRANTYYALEAYNEAIQDYRYLVEHSKNRSDYSFELATSRIKELEKKLSDPNYNEITDLIDQIKKVLLFNEESLTHYTSLSSSQKLILNDSSFRLSEGSYLNDTSEGRDLFNYLSYHINESYSKQTIAEVFVERPFIGSFVSEKKHDDLALWRMYGKEAQTEAKGCSITIHRENFLISLKDKISASQDKNIAQEDLFTFYSVAYRTQEKENPFIIPGREASEQKKLNTLMKQLSEKIQNTEPLNMPPKEEQIIRESLNDIAYLFKSSEYQYEHEVRLVISGVGIEKKISTDYNPPRVYIDLIHIIPIISKITLGPKVERPDEWAAAFNYAIKKAGSQAEIVISHLPFK